MEKKQNLIDILLEISLNNTTSNHREIGHLFTFLARQIANKTNNIKVDDSIFSQVYLFLEII